MLAMLIPAVLAMTAAAAEPPAHDPSIRASRPTLPVITANEHLYEQFGGRPGLTALMNEAMARWMANPHTHPFFARANRTEVKVHLVEQFCVILHGPCQYTGRNMAEAHHGLKIDEATFYALVEELQVAMNHRHIPFGAQNRLLAALAPMSHDVIDK